jgi:hypothetical protein
MRADLRYPDGRQANWSNDAQLHHMVLINSSRRDVTCGTGQRFFASGDERTVVPTVGNFGYRVGLFDAGRCSTSWPTTGTRRRTSSSRSRSSGSPARPPT